MNSNKNNNPIVSIIVPVYNVEKYLDKCINSILQQTFKDFELILVNDGSKDRCGEICDKYKLLDSRIIVINKDNGGLSSARNAGLDSAKGRYISFIDSDDYIDIRMIEMLYDNAIGNNSDIVICKYKNVSEKESNISRESNKYNCNVINYSNIEALKQLYEINTGVFVVAWNKLYKKELFDNLRYNENRIHEDEFIIHKLLHKGKLITYLPIELYYYLKRENSIMSSDFSSKNLDAIYALHERMEYFKNKKLLVLQHKAEYYYTIKFFEYYYRAYESMDLDLIFIREIRKEFNKSLLVLLKNPLFNYKEKLLWCIFFMNPKLHEKYYRRYKEEN